MLRHGWFDGRIWQFESLAVGATSRGAVSGSLVRGMTSSTIFRGHTEVFAQRNPGYSTNYQDCLYHVWWGGGPWSEDWPVYSASIDAGSGSSAGTYPVFGQLHAFSQGGGGVLRHNWYDG